MAVQEKLIAATQTAISTAVESYGALDESTDSVLAYPAGHSVTTITADTAVKSAAGVLHTLTFSCNDAAPTAGTIIVYDNTAESGTILFSETFDTTHFRAYTVSLDVTFATGLYVGFTTVADVNCTVSYR